MSERLGYEATWMGAQSWRAAWLPVLLLAVACEGDGLKPQPLVDPPGTFWELELNHHAVTLSLAAPYNTVALAATPRNYKGESLSGLPAPVYTSPDPELVTVTPDGIVTAQQATGSGYVIIFATLTADNIKHRDSVYVRVIDDPDPPALAAFSIQPIPPDSAKAPAEPGMRWGSGSASAHARNLHTLVRATDAAGNPIPDLLVDFRSSDPTIASVEWDPTGAQTLLGVRVGVVKLYASVTAFGVSKADTLPYRIGWPVSSGVYIQPAAEGSSAVVFSGAEVTIATGGSVLWHNRTAAATDVTFSEPTNVAPLTASTLVSAPELSFVCEYFMTMFGVDCAQGGSFVMPPAENSRESLAARVFPIPGIYEYHSANGASGRVVVVDER